MASAVTRLLDLLKSADLRMTFDPARDVTLPCIGCGDASVPRALVRVGVWAAPAGGGQAAGDRIDRPVCAPCVRRLGLRAMDSQETAL